MGELFLQKIGSFILFSVVSLNDQIGHVALTTIPERTVMYIY